MQTHNLTTNEVDKNNHIRHQLQQWMDDNLSKLLQEILFFYNTSEFNSEATSKEYYAVRSKTKDIKDKIKDGIMKIKHNKKLNFNVNNVTKLFYNEIDELFTEFNHQVNEKRKEHGQALRNKYNKLTNISFILLCAIILYADLNDLNTSNDINESECIACDNSNLLGFMFTKLVVIYAIKYALQVSIHQLQPSPFTITLNSDLLKTCQVNIANAIDKGWFLGKTNASNIVQQNLDRIPNPNPVIVNDIVNDVVSAEFSINTGSVPIKNSKKISRDIYSKNIPISEERFWGDYSRRSLQNHGNNIEQINKSQKPSATIESSVEHTKPLPQGFIIKGSEGTEYIQTGKSGLFYKHNSAKLKEMLHGVSKNKPIDINKFETAIRTGNIYDNNGKNRDGVVPAGTHKDYAGCSNKVKTSTDVRIRIQENFATPDDKKHDSRILKVLNPIDAIPHPKSKRK